MSKRAKICIFQNLAELKLPLSSYEGDPPVNKLVNKVNDSYRTQPNNNGVSSYLKS